MKKLVVITGSLIKDQILEAIQALGAKGYTIHQVCDRDERGVRNDDFMPGESLRNIWVEIITSEATAKKFAASVIGKFYNNYAGIVYLNVKRNPSKTQASRITQGVYCCYGH